MNTARALGATLVALTCLPLGNVALAGEAPVNVQGSKKPDRGYSSSERVGIGPGETKVLYFRVENTTGSSNDVTLGEARFPEGADYKVDWFKGRKPSAQKEITTKVRDGDGFEFTAKAQKSRYFSVRVRNRGLGDPFCLRADLHSEPSSFDSAFFEINSTGCTG